MRLNRAAHAAQRSKRGSPAYSAALRARLGGNNQAHRGAWAALTGCTMRAEINPCPLFPEQPMQLWIGTSGYSYPDWVGPFYPPGTRGGRMLAHYCRRFPLVELNFTFYRPPTAPILERIAQQ